MRNASIISIGNELIHGQGKDTNSRYLSEMLFSMGIEIKAIYSVGDEVDSIVRILHDALNNSELIFMTGGLGPTDDDVTRHALAAGLGVELEFRQELLDRINEYFARRNLTLPQRNKIQAYIPKGSRAMKNTVGTAPGIIGEFDGKIIFSMPGVPVEMYKMYEDSVLPEIRRSIEVAERTGIVVRKLKCFGVGESTIAEKLGDMMHRGRNPEINSTASGGVITLHIISKAKTEEEAHRMALDDENRLKDILKELVYGSGDETLAETVGLQLRKRGKTLAVAESCTGGALAESITNVPGSSDYFTYGWVTYSNEAKIKELGVEPELIQKEGAVSEKVALAMAAGAKKKSGATYSIAITGIAGPEGGGEQKPVGLVYICIKGEEHCDLQRFVFPFDRLSMRRRTVNTALNMLRMQLKV